jgi:hypothetical protein
MSDTAVAERVTLTREEYETLRAGTPATVTITAAEYSELKRGANSGVDPAVHQRCMARMQELESMLRREQSEHAIEVAQFTADLKKYVNPQQ